MTSTTPSAADGPDPASSGGGRGLVCGLQSVFVGIPIRTYVALVVLFVVLQWLLIKITFLPGDRFFEPLLTLEILKALPELGWALLPMAAVLGIMLWRWGSLLGRWDQWQHGRTVRAFSIVAAAVVAWPAATFDYNFYFDQWYAVDRVLVLVLFAGLCWRPVFCWPFLGIVVVMGWQKDWPVEEGIHWAMADMPLRVLILLCAFQLFSLVTRSRCARPFLFLAVCMVVLHYWPSAYLKVRLNWIVHDHIPFFLPNTWANGWWAGASADSIGGVTKALGYLNPVMKVFTLVAECGVLLFFWRRRFSMVLLGMLMSLHIGIFLISGICFWQWVTVEACLLILVWKAKPFRSGEFFTWGSTIVSFLIIFSSKWWLGPVALTWFDARATYTHRFIATGESGETYLLPPRFFAPYEETFTAGRFRYLTKEPVLGITWGATSRKIANRLKAATTEEEILVVESELSKDREWWMERAYNPEKRAMMTEFLQRFLSGIHEQERRKRGLRLMAAPRGIWTLPEEGEFRFQERIVSVRVNEVLSFFDGETVRTIRSRPLLTVEIPEEEP